MDAPTKSQSAVDRLLHFLHLYWAGKMFPTEAAARAKQGLFWLTHAQFAEFERRLWADRELWGWFDDKVRWNWEPPPLYGKVKGKLQVLVPGQLHDGLVIECENALVAAIATLAESLERHGDLRAAEELRKVKRRGRPTIKFEPLPPQYDELDTPRRTPDATFFHPAQHRYPCLVLEVNHGQQRNLPQLADGHIVCSQLATRCVIGLDIAYPAPGRKESEDKTLATLSVWRAAIEKDDDGDDVGFSRVDVDAAPIRSDRDDVVKQGALELTLRDFLPVGIFREVEEVGLKHPDAKLAIPFSTLNSCVATVEEHAAAAARPPIYPSPAPDKFGRKWNV